MSLGTMSLLSLIEGLRARSYRFVTITPASHARVLARADRRIGQSLTDALGWSMPFARDAIDAEMLRLLDQAGAIEAAEDGLLRSRLRASTRKGEIFLHSAYPTDGADSVFFGPDSYRFADLIEAEAGTPNSIVDIGTGAGIGAIVAGKVAPSARLAMTDINPAALRLARANAEAAGVAARAIEGEGLEAVDGPIDLVLANPPYIIDDADRAYRDGGGLLGAEVSLDMARLALDRLEPGGRLILYTGSAIVDGKDALRNALAGLGCGLRYRELDPDVFGEELEKPAYARVDRIALVAAILTK